TILMIILCCGSTRCLSSRCILSQVAARRKVWERWVFRHSRRRWPTRSSTPQASVSGDCQYGLKTSSETPTSNEVGLLATLSPIGHRAVRVEVALHRLGLERIPGRGLLIYVDAQAGADRRGDIAVDNLDRIGDHLVAPGHIIADRLLDQPVRRCQREVYRHRG